MPDSPAQAQAAAPPAAAEQALRQAFEPMLTLTGRDLHLRGPGARLPFCGLAPVFPLAASQAPELYARHPLCPTCASEARRELAGAGAA